MTATGFSEGVANQRHDNIVGMTRSSSVKILPTGCSELHRPVLRVGRAKILFSTSHGISRHIDSLAYAFGPHLVDAGTGS